jgi:thioredoxin reductase
MFDVVIVGGGPAGLSAALVLGRCRRRVLVCDEGRPRNAASLAVHNFMTREGTPPDELLRLARAELRPFAVEQRKAVVTSARRVAGCFRLRLSNRRVVRARKLLLATGIRDHTPDLPGLRRLAGRGVYYCAFCDGYTVRDRPIAALGSGVAGANLALALRTWSDDVTFCTNGSRPPSGKICARLRRYGITVVREPLERVDGRSRLASLTFASGRRLACAGLFVQDGCSPQSELATELGCAFTARGAVRTLKGSRTTVDSVFVAGDAADRPHAAVIAAASGAEAAFCISRELREEEFDLP